MTRSRYRFGEAEYPHFMTWTIVGWLPIFTRPETTKILFDSWRFQQRERDLVLLGYVILENHAHLIATASELSKATQGRLGRGQTLFPVLSRITTDQIALEFSI